MASRERIVIVMSCTACKNKNYHFARGKKKEKKVEVKKYCETCDKHTLHKETKSS